MTRSLDSAFARQALTPPGACFPGPRTSQVDAPKVPWPPGRGCADTHASLAARVGRIHAKLKSTRSCAPKERWTQPSRVGSCRLGRCALLELKQGDRRSRCPEAAPTSTAARCSGRSNVVSPDARAGGTLRRRVNNSRCAIASLPTTASGRRSWAHGQTDHQQGFGPRSEIDRPRAPHFGPDRTFLNARQMTSRARRRRLTTQR